MPISLSIDINALEVLGSLEIMPLTIGAEVERAMVTSTYIVEGAVKSLTPRKTGRLFAGWESSTRGMGAEVVGIVANHVDYAGFIEEGTSAHDIVAKGRALVFPAGPGGGTLSGRARAGAAVVFRKKVRHPGFEGRHMARRGLALAKGAVLDVFRSAIKDAIRLALGK